VSPTKGTVLVFGIVALFLTVEGEIAQNQVARGGEWISWTAAQRSSYVYGYLNGYMKGTVDACNAADDLFEVGQPHRLGDEQHPTDIPSGRCLAHMDREFSKAKFVSSGLDAGAYTSVITDFYTKNPEFQGIPFDTLLLLLSDKKHKAVEELHDMALKGQIRPPR